MDFIDSPTEAEYRVALRAWMAAFATEHDRDTLGGREWHRAV